MPYRYPTELSFDISKTATAFFFEPEVAYADFHWRPGIDSMATMGCPASIMRDGCSVCLNEDTCEKTFSKGIIRCWDCWKKRWCVYIENARILSDVAKSLNDIGIGKDELDLGISAQVILQRSGNKTIVRAVEETTCKFKYESSPPPLADFIEGMRRRSVWLTIPRYN